jgi:FkbM family methyltransferase
MNLKLSRFAPDHIRKYISDRLPRYSKLSYAQSGEDLIVDFVFRAIGIDRPTYLDIGAHHPKYLSNTYVFYKKGSRGICVEPDPILYRRIAKSRPRDICINAGIGKSDREACEFFVMSIPALNTFSRESAELSAKIGGHAIKKIIRIPMQSINELVRRHMPSGPDFVSVDVEGLDAEIIGSIDFSAWRPTVFCVETLSLSSDGKEIKSPEIADLLQSRGYMLYADTFINSIFVDEAKWRERK